MDGAGRHSTERGEGGAAGWPSKRCHFSGSLPHLLDLHLDVHLFCNGPESGVAGRAAGRCCCRCRFTHAAAIAASAGRAPAPCMRPERKTRPHSGDWKIHCPPRTIRDECDQSCHRQNHNQGKVRKMWFCTWIINHNQVSRASRGQNCCSPLGGTRRAACGLPAADASRD
jgi:hypothetical protein